MLSLSRFHKMVFKGNRTYCKNNINFYLLLTDARHCYTVSNMFLDAYYLSHIRVTLYIK